MDRLVYFLALLLVRGLQAPPLTWVARLGRQAGALVYHLDRRHRRVTLMNLQAALGRERPALDIPALAREHFRRLGENYCCAVKTASMDTEALRSHLEVSGAEALKGIVGTERSCVVAIGHFGNFELYARTSREFPRMTSATTYRALKQPRLNSILKELRSKSGCRMFERRSELAALQQTLSTTPTLLGLLCDQHAGRSGVNIPFFGLPCATSTAPAVFALRYHLPLFTAICYRTSLAHWRVDYGEEIPTVQDGRRRTVEEIMRDVNGRLEEAVRRDPPNWFWVHNRWKLDKAR